MIPKLLSVLIGLFFVVVRTPGILYPAKSQEWIKNFLKGEKNLAALKMFFLITGVATVFTFTSVFFPLRPLLIFIGLIWTTFGLLLEYKKDYFNLFTNFIFSLDDLKFRISSAILVLVGLVLLYLGFFI